MKIKKDIAISDSGFLLNPATGESFSLNPLGTTILNLIKEGKSYGEIEKIVLEEYDVGRSTFDKDFQDFTGLLKQYRLLETEKDSE